MAAMDSQRFTALGQEWTIRFDFNSICEIEEETGEKFMVVAAPFLGLVDLKMVSDEAEMLAVAQKLDFANLRQLLFWALTGAHDNIGLPTAGNIIQDIGLPRAFELVAIAISKALPSLEEAEPGGIENPPKPKKSRSRKGAKAG